MTHAVRIRLRNFCLAVLPAGMVFSFLLFPDSPPSLKLPVFPRTPLLHLQSTIRI